MNQCKECNKVIPETQDFCKKCASKYSAALMF